MRSRARRHPLLRELFDQLERLEGEHAERHKVRASREETDQDAHLAQNVQAGHEHEMALYAKQIAIVSMAQAESIRCLGSSSAGVPSNLSSFAQFKSSHLFDKLLQRRLRAPGQWSRPPSHGRAAEVSFASVRREGFAAGDSVHPKQRGQAHAHERGADATDERDDAFVAHAV